MDPSKEGLLSPQNRFRSSLDGRRRASSDTESDIDATEFLTSDPLANPSKNDQQPAFLRAQRQGRLAALRRPFRTRSRCCIITLAVIGILWLLLGAGGAFVYKKYQEEPPYGQSPPWYPAPRGGTAASWAESYKKAADMVSKMTLPEKVNVTTGTGWEMGLAVGTNGPAVHVGFPQLQLQDGPLGIRFADNVSAFPAGITVGATWNKELMYLRGKAHGAEAKAKGIHVLLGPCVGPLGRMPAGGRNWEGFGADPYLQGIAGAETVKGIQSEGVMATIKHFVANEQEHFRQPWEWALPHAISSNIDDRTLHEIYAWPFADAIKAGVASVMCSYNMVNNSYACSNSKLLNGILKDEMGFQGFIMSDWLAQRSGVASALAGLDMTMPGDGLRWQNGKSLWGKELTKSILNGSVPVERLNDMVTRIVAAWYQLGQDDPAKFDNSGPNFSSWTDEPKGIMAPGSPTEQEQVVVNKYVNAQGNHSAIARQVAAEGIVLLKNQGVLPLNRKGIANGKRRHEGKYKVAVFGEDAGPGDGPNSCKDRGCNQGTLGSGWGSGAVEFPYLVTPVDALRASFDDSEVEFSAYLTNSAPRGSNSSHLADQDTCLVFANADSGEGFIGWGSVRGDRPDLQLQKGGDELIAQVAAGCGGDTVVIVHSVGPVIMEKWIELEGVKAVLYANLPGQESGNALVDVLFGDVNPSGKLPYTIGKSLDDYGPGGKIMYLPNGVLPQQDFSEGLYIDYRHFDKEAIDPRFEFGFGLSYTTFEYTGLKVSPIKAKTVLPASRPKPAAEPPTYDSAIPDEKEALWPNNIRPLDKYIYPYLDNIDDIVTKPYPYPDGYNVVQPLSGAGGDEGGNPDLWQTYVSVHVDVKNTGERAGKTVAQLYIAYPQGGSRIDFPEKVLRGFEKVYLEPGETKTVEFNLTRRDLSYWDVRHQNWMILLAGQYTFMVGSSSRDLTVSGTW
ncbi:putative glycoside hydrolase family 3 protein [Phaeoacremonium minimum UCRPA7]|uniref:beta-glucosidase n=1 Tax=Phaeoacremonium minimum (strain UCR-PA7) TaxID=1286976 RepID=R8BRP7_PHAM7|nr:putative glycoside hydrolase family 3 protein [Phaeoacremonium minimum UCRPA7]EOO01960.1 putative glycoside hydrolase family 3 protein [Phaeoacremonium minimum UCRPA7]